MPRKSSRELWFASQNADADRVAAARNPRSSTPTPRTAFASPWTIDLAKKKRRTEFQYWEEALERQRAAGSDADARSRCAPDPRPRDKGAPLADQDDTAEPAETLPHDVHLLERARSHWQFGEWKALAALDADTLHYHPDRAKLALLAATGHAQCGQSVQAHQLARNAIDWGVDRELVTRLLLSGLHNSLARASALAGQDERVRRHFEDALNVGLPGGAAPMAVRARAESELTQIGLEQTLPHLLPATPQPDAPSYLKRNRAGIGRELVVFLPDRQQRLIELHPDQPAYIEQDDDRLLFNVPKGTSLFLSSNPDGQLSNHPAQDLFGLAPAAEYRITGHLACSDRNATAFLIEYDDHDRLAEHSDRAIDNRFDLRVTTSPSHSRSCIAFRIAGRGELDLGLSVLRFQRTAAAIDAPDATE